MYIALYNVSALYLWLCRRLSVRDSRLNGVSLSPHVHGFAQTALVESKRSIAAAIVSKTMRHLFSVRLLLVPTP
jgi:hypothetical protein